MSSLLLLIGSYPIQAAMIAFDHEEPIEICATGHTKEHHGERTDTMANVTLRFKNNRMAVLNCLGENIEAISSLIIYGTKGFSMMKIIFVLNNIFIVLGVVRIPNHFWCPTEILLPNGERKHSTLPTTMKETNFVHSAGLCYEAMACREQIIRGEIEHPLMKHEQSLQIMRILQSAREQILSTRQ